MRVCVRVCVCVCVKDVKIDREGMRDRVKEDSNLKP